MFQPVPVYVGLRYSRARGRSFFVSFISWISLLSLALGVLMLITVISVMNGFASELRARMLSFSAHAVVRQGGAPIPDWRGLVDRLAGSPGLEGAAPDLDIDAMLSHGASMSGAVVRGIDPTIEPRVSTIGEAMRDGALKDLIPGANRIILGSILAYTLQVDVGDTVTVMIPSGGAASGLEPRLQQFQVVGVFEVGLQENDSVLALVNLKDAEAFRGIAGPTEVRLRFDDVLRAPELARQAALRLPKGFEVRDWTQENAAYFRAIRIEKTMMGVILMLIVAVAAFNIVATLVMVVSDKRTDIAILRTLGMTPRGILGVFVTQGLVIGWIGTALGVVLGTILALNASAVAGFLERAFGIHILDDPDVYYTVGLPSELHALDITGIAIIAFLLTLLATVYPAWRAARTQPAEALRYE